MHLLYTSFASMDHNELFYHPFVPGDAELDLNLNRGVYGPGDRLMLDAWIANPLETYSLVLKVILDIGGQYYYYPDWTTKKGELRLRTADHATSVTRLLDITLPDPLETSGQFTFYGGLFYKDSNYVIDFDSVTLILEGQP